MWEESAGERARCRASHGANLLLGYNRNFSLCADIQFEILTGFSEYDNVAPHKLVSASEGTPVLMADGLHTAQVVLI